MKELFTLFQYSKSLLCAQYALLMDICAKFLPAAACCHKKGTTDKKIVKQVTE